MASGLSLEQQAWLVKRWCPSAKIWYQTVDKKRCLFFELRLQPTPTSASYLVRFKYSLGYYPSVRVLDPVPVRENKGKPTPHIYLNGTLCLFDPAKRQWTSADAMVYTTVQWASRWLFHYENWMTFDEWGGDHTPVIPTEEPAVQVEEGTIAS